MRSSKKPVVSSNTSWPATTPEDLVTPPSLWSVMLESRALLEWSAGWLLRHWKAEPALHKNEPVLVLPGMLTDTWAIKPLTDALKESGYDVLAWEEGLNTGPHRDVMRRLSDVILKEFKKRRRPIHLVGWSLGGAMALALAQDLGPAVASVIALGSPLRAHPDSSHLKEIFEWVSGIGEKDAASMRTRLIKCPPCPVTSLVSETDGVVSWRSCCAPIGPLTETIRVKHISHLGMPANPLTCWLVLDRLRAAQRPDWKPFQPKGWMAKLTKVHALALKAKKERPALRKLKIR